MLPALALGAEPPHRSIGELRRRALVDRGLLVRALGVLGLTEAVMALAAFAAVLVAGGWRWGDVPSGALLATASGTAFAAIAVGQLANAFACRSVRRPVWRLRLTTNRLLLGAVAAEVVLLLAFLGFPPLADLLGGGWPSLLGWAAAALAGLAVLLVDAASKRRRAPSATLSR
ncbi:MAG: cation-translocating P-type ATPase C-terminal domain-containing protein [Nocardioides sp.]